jgi:hypothetical protein
MSDYTRYFGFSTLENRASAGGPRASRPVKAAALLFGLACAAGQLSAQVNIGQLQLTAPNFGNQTIGLYNFTGTTNGCAQMEPSYNVCNAVNINTWQLTVYFTPNASGLPTSPLTFTSNGSGDIVGPTDSDFDAYTGESGNPWVLSFDQVNAGCSPSCDAQITKIVFSGTIDTSTLELYNGAVGGPYTADPLSSQNFSVTWNIPSSDYTANPDSLFDSINLAVGQQPVITFDPVSTQLFGASPFQLTAVSSTGAAVGYASATTSVCTVASGLVTLLTPGTCSITASDSTDGATPVTRTFAVNTAKPSGTLTAIAGSPFPTGNTPVGAATGDFNGDGIPDLVTTNSTDNTVTVLLGNSTGGGYTAAPGSPFPAGTTPVAVVAGDFNGDGALDLAIADSGGNNITILLGNGRGGFTAGPGSPFSVGTGPAGLATGDFNGDGIEDIAVANKGQDTVTVLLGAGSGSFTQGAVITVGGGPTGIVVGDFNGDGFQDLATANESGNNVAVLRGNGSGGFQAVTEGGFGVGTNPVGLVIGDFNADGIPDLAITDLGGGETSGDVTVLLGNGPDSDSGWFSAAPGSPFVLSGTPNGLVAGDFNGDGIQDLAVAVGGANGIVVLLGNKAVNAAPVFIAAGSPFASGNNPTRLVAADFNGDGILDLAATSSAGNNLAVLLGGVASTNSVLSTTSPLTINVGQAVPLSLTVSGTAGGFNAPTGAVTFLDGGTGIATATQTTSPYTFTVASPGTGTHTYTASYAGDLRSSASSSNTITIQVNGDPQTITFGALSNQTLGSIPPPLSATSTSGLTVTFASTTTAVCTVSGTTITLLTTGSCSITASQTGNATYAAATPVPQSFTVSNSTQTITFGPLSTQTVGVAPPALSATASSGLTVTFASTTPTVCTVSGTTITLLIAGSCSITASQAGNGSYQAATPVVQAFTVLPGTQTITFDSLSTQIFGGSPFAIGIQSSSSAPVSVTQSTPTVCKTADNLVMLLGAGTCTITVNQPGTAGYNAATPATRSFSVNAAKPSGTLTATAASPIAVGTNSTFMAVADFNRDGIPDLATVDETSATLSVLLGDGSGGFTPAPGSPFGTGVLPRSVAAGDFNGDGIPDLAVANYGDGTVTVLLGNGSGGFNAASASPVSLGTSPFSIAVGDFNGDGIQDLVTGNVATNNVTVMLGNGQGGFTAATGSPFTVGSGADSLVVAAVGDFNGDGKQDLAGINSASNDLTVLLGNGSGGFTPAIGSPLAAGSSPQAVVVGDFNGDGIQDLAIANADSDNVTVLLGNGAGGFTEAAGSPFMVSMFLPSSLVAGDFNGDGITDLAVAVSSGTTTILLGNGSGGFTAVVGSFGGGQSSIAAADFNGDGILDMATTSAMSSNLTVLLGGPALTTSTLTTTSPATITVGQSVSLNLVVADTGTAFNAPTNAAIFSDGTTQLGPSTQTTSPYTFTATGLALGTHVLSANYPGDTRSSASTSNTITIQVNPATSTLSVLTSGNLGEIGQGAAVSTTFAASGGTSPYVWSANGLPASVFLNGQTGALTGTPAAGNYTFAVTVTDSETPPATAVVNATLDVLGITTTSLPNAATGVAYSQTLAAAGGTGHYTFSSSNLPAGLSLSGTTLSGTPTSAGTFPFQVQVGDGSGTVASASLSLTVTGAALTITGSGKLGEIALGTTVAANPAATGGKPPYTWTAQNLPAGVSLNATSGALGGTPSQPGNYSFTLQVSDSQTPAATASLPVTLQVLGFLTGGTLPAGSTTTAYSQTLSAAGGTGPYTFSSTNLPAGLSLSGATLSGTPSKVGSYSFTVTVGDAASFAASSSFSLQVTGPATTPLSVGGGALTGGAVGVAYSQEVTAAGGTPPYTWIVEGGALPPGLSLDGPSGTISGTPSMAGLYTFTAQATDSAKTAASGVFTITIAPPPISLSGLPFPNGIVGSSYPLQILTGSGGVGPYTFAVTGGTLPPGLSFSSGELSGIPTSSGTFGFTITATDSETPPLTVSSATQVVIASAANANLILSAGSLSFNLTTGAAGLPASDNVTVQSSIVQQLLTYSVVTTPQVSWLDVGAGGSTPGSFSVGLDPSATNLGASATPLTTDIVVTCLAPSPCAGLSQNIGVSLSVTAPAPELTFLTNLVQFSTSTAASATISQQVAVQNIGGGSATLSSASAADTWLTVTGVPASVPSGPPVNLTFTANPAGLGVGFYRTVVTIESTGGTITVPVTLSIASAPSISLSTTGAQFQSILGTAPGNTTGSFQVGVTGASTLNWTASVLPGSSWLVLGSGSASGSATTATPSTVAYSIDPVAAAALTPAQAYYGTIQIAAAGATNSPQNFLVILNVAPAKALPVPDPEPAGLIFISAAGGSAPAPKTITVYSSSPTAVNYSASATAYVKGTWLAVSPATGTSSVSSPGISTVTVTPGALPVGIYFGTVSYQFSAAAVRTVNVTLLVLPAGFSSILSEPRPAVTTSQAPACTPTQLVPTQTGLVTNFAQPAAWPTPLSLTVLDNCGSSVGTGQVIATFSNGDPPLALKLANASTGLYSGTWTPRALSGQVSVTATVNAPGFSQSVATITGQVVANAAPALASGGVLHIYDPLVGAALGQGTILQIYGTNMGASPAVPTSVPLPTSLNGTSVIVGGIPAPLYYVSAGQIDAQLPYELTPGNSYQVIVNANGALSTPQTVQISAATPGMAAFASGQIVAQHQDYSLVSETSPAKPGEYLVIYLSGLGQTNNVIPDGTATPASPFSIPVVAPVLTLNGVSIPIYFSGLTPGYVGLFQMNFQVPPGTPNGDMQLVVSQAGTAGNSTILPVHN